MNSLEEYVRATEPDKREKGYAWNTAIGLQAVDGLQTSEYLLQTAKRNIEGEISFETANELIRAYYEEHPKEQEARTEEADKVSAGIAQILSEKSFQFSPTQYLAIHGRLFEGIYAHAGKMRTYNITKEEWVLEGDTVLYGGASELKAMLEYDLNREREFCYQGLNMEQTIRHLARFIADLWQIHAFAEGNTRTTAVFFIKYLRSLGFEVQNDGFAQHAWYFRNALVRANYTNLKKNVYETTVYLELFLRNLLLDERNELHNRAMHISGVFGTAECLDEPFDYTINYVMKKEERAEKAMKVKAVLFDLDGTLLPMDYDGFLKLYFGTLAKRLAKYGYDPEALVKNIWTGTGAMVKNDGSCMNETRFWDTFAEIYGVDVLQDKVLFDDFYREDFGKAKEACGFEPLAKQAVEELKRREIPVVLATNPIFPMIATRQRIEWAGLSVDDFKLCTTYENIGYSKPNPAYYTEIAKRIGVAPEECLMVGNDVSEDMVAAKVGMQVFLLTDCLLNKKEEDISGYPQGGFAELLEHIKAL